MAYLENEPKLRVTRPAVHGVGLVVKWACILRWKLTLAAANLAVAIFFLDLSLPLGVAGGVPYVVLVIIGWWFEKTRFIFVLAAICSVLTVAGYFLSVEGGIAWMVLANRFFALFAVWATAILLAKAKHADMALRNGMEQFRSVLNNLPAKIHIKDLEGRYLLVNKEAGELFGVTDEEARGKTTHEIFPEKRADDFRTHDQAVLETGQTIAEEEEWQREDGIYTYLTVKFPLRDADGRITGIGAMGTDITERKWAEEAVYAAKEEAEIANRAKSEFLATMSHELRTPLNAIIGFSEVMVSDILGPVSSDKYREYANDIYESGQHLLELINDILDLSKVESGMDELHEEDVDIPVLAESVLRLVWQRAEEHGVKLNLEISDEPSGLRADNRKMKQILVNLLSNAVKFTEAGGVVTLKIWCDSDSGYIFQIVDTGIGMAPEDIPKALSQFGQIDSNLSRQYQGTGLGLPLTKGLVELHGGCLDLQSQVGVGTTVTVRFPAARSIQSRHETRHLGVNDRQVS